MDTGQAVDDSAVVTMGGMRVELLVVPDCPNEHQALELFRSVLTATGMSGELTTVVVDTEEAAVDRRFVGSPSFFIDGADLLPAPEAPPAIACRLYRSRAGGLTGLPSAEELEAALRERSEG